ncbi:MAG: LysR family transcriptional regulator [Solirubrobacteraceae bacterium]
MDVHVRELRYFVAVAEELHFTRAAERLFVSQPALSKQIRALEEQLRVDLFVRDHRSVSLTPAGGALLPAARELIAVWDAAQQAVADAAAAAAAVLRIGFSTSVGRGLLPRIQEHFAGVRPNWRLALRQVDWDDPSGGLRDGSTDLTIVWLPVPAADRFAQLVLVQEPRHVALRTEHPLAGRREIEFAELLDEPFLALPEDAGSPRDYWLAVEHRGGRPARIGGIVTNAEETFEAVLAGLGVALLSAGNAEIYRRPGVATVPVRGISPSRLALLWRGDDHREAVRDFIRAAERAVPLDETV